MRPTTTSATTPVRSATSAPAPIGAGALPSADEYRSGQCLALVAAAQDAPALCLLWLYQLVEYFAHPVGIRAGQGNALPALQLDSQTLLAVGRQDQAAEIDVQRLLRLARG